jgi:ectoine hydroxylase-related dioxygenase (phytanoyl-CoA dioxygenase family)
MNTVFFDPQVSDDLRRKMVYEGQLVVCSPTSGSLALCEFARELGEKAFAPLDPREAQHHLPVERFAAILAELKPKFIHHSRSKQLIQQLLAEIGCDLEKTHFDVPRLRTSTHGGYLSSGISYAFHPHRDTWYSAPFCQINWWLPIYEIQPENVMAFHPRYWTQPVKNGSHDYNYQEWNRTSRQIAAQQIGVDTRKQPRPEEPMELDPQIRVVGPVGSVLLFSAAQMHSTVPNTSGRTRLSIDFRTVHSDDALARRGARNIDSDCTGTCMGDYLRGTNLAHVPEEIIAMYDTPPHHATPASVAEPAEAKS